MAQRLLRTSVLSVLATALLLGGTSTVPDFANADRSVSISALLGSGPSQVNAQPELRSAIAFASTRDNPDGTNPILPGVNLMERRYNAGEIYLMLMKQDGTPDTTQSARRLTDNVWGDLMSVLSPDGKKIVFVSNRLRANGPINPSTGQPYVNISDLFVMNTDGTQQMSLTLTALPTITRTLRFT